MFDVKLYKKNPSEMSASALFLLMLAGKSYGPCGSAISYRTDDGAQSTRSMAEALRADTGEIGQAGAAFRELFEEGQDGVKTALLLAGALAEYGMVMREGWDVVLHTAYGYLEKAAAELGGNLPGGGLWLLGLQRPLNALHYADAPTPAFLDAFVRVLKTPLIKLTKSNGLDAYDVHAQIKGVMPNQFYSLHHYGLAGSIPDESPYSDFPRIGLNVCTNRLEDLVEGGVVISLEEGKRILRWTAEICKRL